MKVCSAPRGRHRWWGDLAPLLLPGKGIMGYDLAIPATVIILLPAIVVAVFFVRKRAARKRLDFRKGTTYEEPQDEGTPSGSATHNR